MKESINIWGIQEFEGDGISCPIVPVNLPWHKKVILTFFRFGICPMCIVSGIVYSTGKFFRYRIEKGSNKIISSANTANSLSKSNPVHY